MLFTEVRASHYLIAIFTLSMIISGCSSIGSDSGPSDAALSGDSEAMWADGQKMAEKGEELTADGEERLSEGRSQVRDGEKMIREGNTGVSTTRIDYQNAARATGEAATPTLVGEEAKRLKIVGKRWQASIDMIRDGNKLVKKGNKNIDKGQAEIREGRMLLDSASNMMRNSKRAQLGAQMLPHPDSR